MTQRFDQLGLAQAGSPSSNSIPASAKETGITTSSSNSSCPKIACPSPHNRKLASVCACSTSAGVNKRPGFNPAVAPVIPPIVCWIVHPVAVPEPPLSIDCRFVKGVLQSQGDFPVKKLANHFTVFGVQAAVPGRRTGGRVDFARRTSRRCCRRLIGGSGFFEPLDVIFGLFGEAGRQDGFLEFRSRGIRLIPPGQPRVPTPTETPLFRDDCRCNCRPRCSCRLRRTCRRTHCTFCGAQRASFAPLPSVHSERSNNSFSFGSGLSSSFSAVQLRESLEFGRAMTSARRENAPFGSSTAAGSRRYPLGDA